MTVSSVTTPRISYVGNDVTVTYSIPFVFVDEDDIVIVSTNLAGVDTTLSNPTHYSITGGGANPATGSAVFVTAPTSSETITIYRKTVRKQEMDLQAYDVINADNLEAAFDKVTLQIQDLKDEFDRAVSGELIVDNVAAADAHFVVTTTEPDLPNSQVLTAGSGITLTPGSGTLTISTSGGLADGDYGDVTVSSSGTVFTIDNDSVTYSKIQNVSATDKLLGRISSGSGDIEEVTFTDFAQGLLDDADASAARTTLGLGTLATQSGTFSGSSSGTNTGDQNVFSTIAVSGQSNVVADSTSDTLTLIAGSNVTITTDATGDSITISSSGGGGGGGLSDGDYGDITVSGTGTALTIDSNAVTAGKLATSLNLTPNTIEVRDDKFTVSDGVDSTKKLQFELSGITTGNTRIYTVPDATTALVGTDTTQTLTNKSIDSGQLTGTIDAGRFPALTGDVTTSAGSVATTIANTAVTYAKMQNISATQKILGRNTAGSGSTEEITVNQILSWLSTTQGAVLYYNGSSWTALSPGTSGQVLQTQGGSADPQWANIPNDYGTAYVFNSKLFIR